VGGRSDVVPTGRERALRSAVSFGSLGVGIGLGLSIGAACVGLLPRFLAREAPVARAEPSTPDDPAFLRSRSSTRPDSSPAGDVAANAYVKVAELSAPTASVAPGSAPADEAPRAREIVPMAERAAVQEAAMDALVEEVRLEPRDLNWARAAEGRIRSAFEAYPGAQSAKLSAVSCASHRCVAEGTADSRRGFEEMMPALQTVEGLPRARVRRTDHPDGRTTFRAVLVRDGFALNDG
jgi:hypothetical protein